MNTHRIIIYFLINFTIAGICHSQPNKNTVHLPQSFDRCTFAILNDFYNDDRPFQSSIVPKVGLNPMSQAVLIDHVFREKNSTLNKDNLTISEFPALVGLRIAMSKYTTCHALVLYTFPNLGIKSLEMSLELLVKVQITSNPQFVIIQHEYDISLPLQWIRMSSVYLFFSSISTSLILPCAACPWPARLSSQLLIKVIDNMSIPDIKRAWFLTNKNLKKNLIHSPSKNSNGENLEIDCSSTNNPKMSITYEDDCAKIQLSVTHNYTLSHNYNVNIEVYGHVTSGIPSTSRVNEKITTNLAKGTFQTVIHGYKVEPFHFAVITDPRGVNLSTIFMPFDGITWSILVTILTLLLMLLSAGQRHTKEKIVSHHLLWASTVFLEQSDPISFKKTAYQNKMPLLIPLWLILSFFCGVFYKGAVYSFVTAKEPLAVPHTLGEVVRQHLPIVTSTLVTWGNLVYYPLKVVIVDLLSNKTNTLPRDTFSLLISILNSTKWLIGDETEIA